MTVEQEAVELLDTRDTLYEAARKARPPASGYGLSIEQASYFGLAEKAHRRAVARLASLHPAYSPAPWGEDFDAV